MSQFTDVLLVSPLADGKSWVLRKPFGYDVGEVGSGDTVTVQEGFVTDFASIPRLFWFVLPQWGKYGNAAVIHDWLYWDQKRTRDEADYIMLEAMGELKVPKWQKHPIFWAVRVFGGIAWKRNQWDKKAEFSRVKRSLAMKSVAVSNRPGVLRRAVEQLRREEKQPTETH